MTLRRSAKRVSFRACLISLSRKIRKNLNLSNRPLIVNKMIEKRQKYLTTRTMTKMSIFVFLLQGQESYNNRQNNMTLIMLLLIEKYRVSIKSLLTSRNSTFCNKEKIKPRSKRQNAQFHGKLCQNSSTIKYMYPSRMMSWLCLLKMIKNLLNSLKMKRIWINGKYQNGV